MPPKTYKQYKKKAKAARKASGLPKPQAKAVKAIVKAQMSKVIETKHADYLYEPTPVNSMYHNQWFLFENDPLTLLQGVQDAESLNPPNRIGDTVYTKGIKYNILFQQFNDRPNMAFRILVLLIKPDTTTVVNPTNHPQAACNIIKPVDYENSRIKKVLYDKTFIFNNNASNLGGGVVRDTKFYWEHYIKLNRVTQYEDGINSARNYTVACWALAYDTVNSLETDNICRFSYARRHIFQDA